MGRERGERMYLAATNKDHVTGSGWIERRRESRAEAGRISNVEGEGEKEVEKANKSVNQE